MLSSLSSPCLPHSLNMAAIAPGKHPHILSNNQKDLCLPRVVDSSLEAPVDQNWGHMFLCKLGKGKGWGGTLASGSQNVSMSKVYWGEEH